MKSAKAQKVYNYFENLDSADKVDMDYRAKVLAMSDEELDTLYGEYEDGYFDE